MLAIPLFEIFNLPAVTEHEGIAVFQQVDDRMIVVDPSSDPLELGSSVSPILRYNSGG